MSAPVRRPPGPPPNTEPVSLEHARRAGIDLILAEQAYCAAIVAAHESGNSLRTLADTLGVSSHKINRILLHHPRFQLNGIGESKT